jgi:RNA polymerase sigma-32 factor
MDLGFIINNSLKQYALLTAEQQVLLTRQFFETKDKKIKDILVKSNLKLVASRVSNFSKKVREMQNRHEDLFQEGCVGLVRGIEKFDPNRNCKLSTYLIYWIDAYLHLFISKNISRNIRLDTNTLNKNILNNINRYTDSSKIPEKDKEQVDKILQMIRNSSYDEPIEYLKTSEDSNQESLVIRKDLYTKMSNLVDNLKLTDQERYVLQSRILEEDVFNFREIAESFNVSRQRIQQIDVKVRSKLQKIRNDLR